MADRITHNPNLEVAPNFADDTYAGIRNMLVNAGKTEAEALQDLLDAWTAGNARQRETWAQQEAADRNLQEAQAQVERDAAEQQRQELEHEAELERCEVEKKKPKLNDFDDKRMVSDAIAPRPSPYAINKLQNFKYVELFYFTPQGCLDAVKNAHTAADDALGLTGTDGYVTLRPIAAYKASRNVVRDEDLTWDQMIMGKNAMLQKAKKLGWSVKHVTALMTFYFNLEQHPSHMLESGN
ncbi:hypothetical protein JAAARDRAFT_137548 [Jaapia argillacea MUCL 33604]|uniref:Uncharacterized protein n=1 Tax=Jaapia argillacea MUCL 33604 TaxID=933084 RepID=A0A067PED5_9AGAM|nr:hypothetical protein JAAARDRAFT_137548 [Jaapia argillacea MUCL 33604]